MSGIFSVLPTELKVYLLSFLPPKDLLTMSETNKEFNDVCQDNDLWKHVAKVLRIRLPSDAENAKLALRGKISQAYSSIQRVVFSTKSKALIDKNPDPFERYSKTLENFFTGCRKNSSESDRPFENDDSDSSYFDSSDESDTENRALIIPQETYSFKLLNAVSSFVNWTKKFQNKPFSPDGLDLKPILKTFNPGVIQEALRKGVKIEKQDCFKASSAILNHKVPKNDDLSFFLKLICKSFEQKTKDVPSEELCDVSRDIITALIDEGAQPEVFHLLFFLDSVLRIYKKTCEIPKSIERNRKSLQEVNKKLEKKEKLELKKIKKLRKEQTKLIHKLERLEQKISDFNLKHLHETTLTIVKVLVSANLQFRVAENENEEEQAIYKDLLEKTLALAITLCDLSEAPTLLQILIEGGAQSFFSGNENIKSSLDVALKCKNKTLIDLMIAHGGKPSLKGLDRAARKGDIALLTKLLKLGTKPGPKFFSNLLKSGKLKAIIHFATINEDFGSATLDDAIESEDPKIINWARQAGLPCTDKAFTKAIKTRNLDMLHLAIEAGARPDEHSFKEAALSKRPQIFQLALDSGAQPLQSSSLLLEMVERVTYGKLNIEMLAMAIDAGLTGGNKIKKDAKSFKYAFKHALESGNKDLLSLVIRAGALPIEKIDNLAKKCGEDQELLEMVIHAFPPEAVSFETSESDGSTDSDSE